MVKQCKQKICFVIQRYGTEICGGSELHCRLFAERLSSIYDVEIVTTTALDDSTWKNFYKEGVEYISGIKVRRFNVDRERLWERERNIKNYIQTAIP